MRQLIEILKNKKSRPILYVGIVFIILIFFLILSRSPSGDSPEPVPFTTTSGGGNPSFFTSETEEGVTYAEQGSGTGEANSFNGLSEKGIYEDPTPPSQTTAIQAKAKLASDLPIYIENFETSVGKLTDINIFTVPGDRKDTVRLEIYNINYQETEVREEFNSDVTAFKESFVEAKKRIEGQGVKMEDLNFIFGTRDHIQHTANYWVKTLGLL